MTDELGDDFSAVLVDAVDDLGQRGNTFIIVDANLAVLTRFHLIRRHHPGNDDAGTAVSQVFIHFGQLICRKTVVPHSFKSCRTDKAALRFNTADVTCIK